MAYAFAEIAFTPSVRDQQNRNGSGSYAKFLSPERSGGDVLGERERSFVQARDGMYQATVSETGWPYVQFRGGAPGFLRVLDKQTIAYADLRGNRQYISLGNLVANDRIALILIDYVQAERIKIWGRAHIVDRADPDWSAMPAELKAKGADRVITIRVEAFDWNCPRHIPQRFTPREAHQEIEQLRQQNEKLRALVEALRAVTNQTPIA